jgi:UDP-2,3-diacylglucosamine hydrolase
LNKRYLFISDIHLGLESKESEDKKEKLLTKFLQFAKDNCDELFIVGDLYDYWFDYKWVVQKGNYRTLTALKDLTEKGIAVHYFMGNHEFMRSDFFSGELGLKMYLDPLEFNLNNKKFYIGHGDGLVKNDNGYLILKKILRNKLLQKTYSLIHPDLGIGLAKYVSNKSRSYTAKKEYGEVDGLFETAKEKIEQGYDYVIFGHVHKRSFQNYKNGYYINLGSWLEAPCYGVFYEDKFEIIEWN